MKNSVNKSATSWIWISYLSKTWNGKLVTFVFSGKGIPSTPQQSDSHPCTRQPSWGTQWAGWKDSRVSLGETSDQPILLQTTLTNGVFTDNLIGQFITRLLVTNVNPKLVNFKTRFWAMLGWLSGPPTGSYSARPNVRYQVFEALPQESDQLANITILLREIQYFLRVLKKLQPVQKFQNGWQVEFPMFGKYPWSPNQLQ